MAKRMKKGAAGNLLLALLAVLLLAGFAFAVPSGALKEEAQERYLDEAPEEEGEYDFLFD